MNIYQLQYFVETVRCGSYARAAKNVFLSPSGILRAVGDLEKELGIKLVERSGRGVRPTSQGRILYEKALEVIDEVDDFRSLAKAVAAKPNIAHPISISICATPYRGIVLSQHVLDAVYKLCPKPSSSIYRGTSSTCLAALEEGVVQAAIILGRVEKGWASCSRLFSFCPQVAVSKSHPLALKKDVALSDLLDYPIARPYDLRYSFKVITEALEKAGRGLLYEEVFPSEESHIDFMQRDKGVVFVAYDASLESIYPDAAFLQPRDFGVMIPVCFVYDRENGGEEISSVKNRLVIASRFPHLKQR